MYYVISIKFIYRIWLQQNRETINNKNTGSAGDRTTDLPIVRQLQSQLFHSNSILTIFIFL